MRAWLWLCLGCGGSPDPAPVDPPAPEPVPEVRCGDGVLASDEACDDGNSFGGDGCLPDCTVEPDPLESEPNDAWDAAEPWPGEPVHGGLPLKDVDCFAIEAADCLSVTAALTGDCPADGVLALHDPSGVVVATGSPGPDGCSRIDPVESPGARFAAAGPHAVCLTSLTGTVIPAYTLDISLTSSDGFPLSLSDDPDGDGLPASCDDDQDGDGVLDAVDTCIDVSNGPLTPPLTPSVGGFVQDWLTLAPLLDTVSAFYCLPSDVELPGGDALLAPRLGDLASGLTWVATLGTGDVFDFLPAWGFAPAPREVYVHAYVYSATQRDLTLAVGADDGVRVWLEGAVLLDIASCQGTNIDQFQAPATLLAGWNRLTVKVRDQGGGWGLAVRFLDAGVPVTDLEISLSPDGSWAPDQSDGDGDGLGDVCDDTP